MNRRKCTAKDFFAMLSQGGKWGMDGHVTGVFGGEISGIATFRPAGRSGQAIIEEEDCKIPINDQLGPVGGKIKKVYQLRDHGIIIAGGHTAPSIMRLEFGTYGRAIGSCVQGKTQHDLELKWRPSKPDLFTVKHCVTAPLHQYIATTNYRRLAPEAE